MRKALSFLQSFTNWGGESLSPVTSNSYGHTNLRANLNRISKHILLALQCQGKGVIICRFNTFQHFHRDSSVNQFQ